MKMPYDGRRSGSHSRCHGYGAVLSPRDNALLIDALSALLRERSRAMELSRTVLSEKARNATEFEDFGIGDILRVTRLLETVARGESTKPSD